MLSQTLWIVPFGTLPLLFLRYPDGQLPSPRWRCGVLTALGAMALLVGPGTAGFWRYRHDDVETLLFADQPPVDPLVEVILWSAVALVLAALAIAAASLVVRWRRSRSVVERLQLKWLLLSGMILCTHAATLFVSDGGAWVETLQLGGLLSVPLAIAVAVTRYRLYEIDRILSRSVSYVLLTLLLVGVYVTGVLGIGALIGGASGVTGSDAAVALSTLIVAGLFLPLRRRIQTMVDRRFNRARYDALRTVESFAARLRDELDLDMLEVELQHVITETLQPAWSAAWITRRTDPLERS